MAMVFSIYKQPRARFYAIEAHIGSGLGFYLNFDRTQIAESAYWEMNIVGGCLAKTKIIAINMANLLAKQKSAAHMEFKVIVCEPTPVFEEDEEPKGMEMVA